MTNDINSIVDKYSGMVAAISYRMIENREQAKEAAQESWIEIAKSLPNFEGESQISTWIYRIASRTILRYAKKEKQYSVKYIKEYYDHHDYEYTDNKNQDEKEWVKDMCNKCVTGSLHCLTNEERLIYLLYDAAGLSSKEIANILSISDASIRKKMSRNRKKLHSFLNDQCFIYNPDGNCKCRMANSAKTIDLNKESKKILNDINEISFLHRCDKVLSTNKTFFDDLCHSYKDSSTNTIDTQ